MEGTCPLIVHVNVHVYVHVQTDKVVKTIQTYKLFNCEFANMCVCPNRQCCQSSPKIQTVKIVSRGIVCVENFFFVKSDLR